jgi:hypothetical protein
VIVTSAGRPIGALVLVAVAVIGCSSSGRADGSSPPPSTAPAGTPSAPGAAPAGASASGVPANAATARAVAKAYEAFFDSASDTATSEAALQHGSLFAKTLDEQSKTAYAQKSSASVSAVRVAGDLAYVTFTVKSNGAALLVGAQGYAVREGGRWKVAATTFCGLLALQGDAPSPCKDATITALPH